MATTLFTNVQVLDGTGAQPCAGEVLVRDNRIARVSKAGEPPQPEPDARVINGNGATLMPGLCDAHTHFSWTNQTNLDAIGMMPVEEHVLAAAANAKMYLDCGYTMCVGAAAAKPRLDVVIRNAINKGQIPGPRYLANGPEEMRRTVRRLIGVRDSNGSLGSAPSQSAHLRTRPQLGVREDLRALRHSDHLSCQLRR